MSTAYCHCGESVLEEQFYPLNTTPEEIINIVDETPDSILETITSKILGDQPNTYAFSKALSEELVRRSGLPAAIARPSIGNVGFPFFSFRFFDKVDLTFHLQPIFYIRGCMVESVSY